MLTQEELDELNQIVAHRNAMTKADHAALRKIARDPIKRRKTFKVVPGAALSHNAARLAQFYEQAWPEQRAALDTLMSLFTAGAKACHRRRLDGVRTTQPRLGRPVLDGLGLSVSIQLDTM